MHRGEKDPFKLNIKFYTQNKTLINPTTCKSKISVRKKQKQKTNDKLGKYLKSIYWKKLIP